MTVTERLILPTQGGVEAWREPVKVLLQTLKKQEGNIRTRWGPHSENENNLEFLIGWESTQAQAKFQATPDFEEVMSALKPILTGNPTVYFIEFKPYAPKEVIDAPLVEVLSITGSNSSEDTLRTAIGSYKGIAGCTGVAGGFSLTDVEGKGKIFVAVIGWNSLAESESGRLAKSPSVDGQTELHHVNFRFPVKGFRGL